MKSVRHIFLRLTAAVLTFVAAFATSEYAQAATKTPVWEVVRVTEPGGDGVGDDSEGAFEVETRDGFIYISAPQPVKVEVFTILGQLVTSRTLAPGTVRLRLGNRGIYILKGEGTTRRVNL